MPVDKHGAGYSAATERKQMDLGVIFPAYLAIFQNIQNNPRYHFYRRCLYVDLTAGPGMVDDRIKGSPLIMLEAAAARSVPVKAYLIDESPSGVRKLRERLAAAGLDGSATVLEGDYHDRIDDVERALGANARRALGLVYWDANADEPPWELLRRIARTLPYADLLLNIGAAYRKWEIAKKRRENTDLLENLRGIGKQHIQLREPLEHAQWTLALLSNGGIVHEKFRARGFRPLGTPECERIADLVNLTKPQLRAKYQPPLLGEDGVHP